MARPSVFVTRNIERNALLRLQQFADVEVWPLETPPSKNEIKARMAALDGILTMLTDPMDDEMIRAGGSNFRVISQMAVGYDNIDVQTATMRKIPVGHTPGVLTEACADFTFALLLSAARRIAESDSEVRQGVWRPWGPDVLTGFELNGATLGIIGFGRIGQAVARRAKGFGLRILYHDPSQFPALEDELGVEFATFNQILQESDFISLHAYLSPETRKMINRDAFSKMKPNTILVNTARGAIIDSDALIWALEEKIIAGAGLDVFDPEPIPVNHPILNYKNVVITPHIASAGLKTRQKMAEIAVDNLLAGLNGKPLPYCANPQIY